MTGLDSRLQKNNGEILAEGLLDVINSVKRNISTSNQTLTLPVGNAAPRRVHALDNIGAGVAEVGGLEVWSAGLKAAALGLDRAGDTGFIGGATE